MARTAYHKTWRAANADALYKYHRDWKLQRKFGISLLEYDALLTEQKGVCALCGGKDKTRALAVDHCHKTKAIRGLLCLQCNTALGRLGDTPEALHRVMAYLTRGSK